MVTNSPSTLGNFSYPPPGSHLRFNHIDSVVTSWLIFDPDATGCRLSVWWYWPGKGPWKAGLNDTAPANGTAIVPLDFSDGQYIGQLNINYNGSDGCDHVFVGPFFDVDTSPRSSAVTWSQGVLAAPISSSSAGQQTSNSASIITSSASSADTTTSDKSSPVLFPYATSFSLVTSSALLATTTTLNQPAFLSSSSAASALSISKPSATNGSHFSAGAIAGIVVGIVVSAGIAATLIYYRRRKAKNAQAEVKTSPSAEIQSPVPAGFVGEKDGSPIGPNELPAQGQLLEMATNNN